MSAAAVSDAADITDLNDSRDYDDQMEVPLLRRSLTIHTPPRQAFSFFGRSGRIVSSDNERRPAGNNGTTPSMEVQVERNHQTRRSLVGYQGSFLHQEAFMSWGFVQSLGMAFAVGLLVAGFSLFFVALVLTAHNFLFDYSFEKDQLDRGPWKWVIITTVGSLLSRGLLLLVATPHPTLRIGGPVAEPYLLLKLEESQQLDSQFSSSTSISSFKQFLSTLLAYGVTLSTLPLLGPEFALVSMARNISHWLSRRSSCLQEEEWSFICFSCVWASFAPMPLIGPLVMLELRAFSEAWSSSSTVTRASPMGLVTLSTVASIASYSLVHLVLDVSGSSIRLFNNNSAASMPASTISTRLNQTLQTTPWNITLATFFDNNTSENEQASFTWWLHLVAAPCVGAVCGVVSAILLASMALLHKILQQAATSHSIRVNTAAAETARTSNLVPTFSATALSGLLQGLLLVMVCPLLSLSSLEWISLLLSNESHQQLLPRTTGQLALLLLAQMTSIVLSLGLGEVEGGCILPLVVIGGWVGKFCVVTAMAIISPAAATASSVSFLAVLCGMVACPVAVLPVPLTATLTVMLLWADSAHQVAPILLASLAAWTVTRGSGLLHRVEQWAYFDSTPPPASQGLDQQGEQIASTEAEELYGGGGDDDDIQLPSDDDILRGIRSAIFGGGAQLESNHDSSVT